MEFTLREVGEKNIMFCNLGVLILVFVEFTLRAVYYWLPITAITGLNPCFCGIYSQRLKSIGYTDEKDIVLILVFVEFTLRERQSVLKH